MKFNNRNVLAWILAVGLAAGLLGGCGSNTGKAGESQVPDGGSGQEEDQGNSPDQEVDRDGEPKAMGRYVETEIELPQELQGRSFLQLLKGKDGSLELYAAERGPSGEILDTVCYVYQEGAGGVSEDGDGTGEGVWKRKEDWTGNEFMKERAMDLETVVLGRDGAYYLGGTDETYQYHLFRMEEDGSGTELLADVFRPEAGKDYGLIPPKFEVLDQGNILIYGYDQVTLYEPSGNRLCSMAKDFTGSTDDARGFSQGEEFVTILDGMAARYSLQDGKLIENISIDEVKGQKENLQLFGDGAGGIYLVSEAGLSHVSRGGTLWEVLMDGSLNHLGMRSLYLRRFLAGEHQDYYGIFTNDKEGIQLFHYVYDPNTFSVPPKTLSVYSLEDHSTVRQAASLFQSEHPDVKVELRTAAEEGETVTEEMIQGLNTELLSGKGADVLILDGLPVNSYIEKGILMDLSEMMAELERDGNLSSNILDGFREADGAVYQIPARISFPLVIGGEKEIQAYESLQSMAEYQGDKPLVPAENYENLLRFTANLQYEELFGQEGGLTEEKLVQYLETVKAMGEASGAKTTFSQEEMERELASNHVLKQGMAGDMIHYDMGKCSSGSQYMDGFGDLCIPAAVKRLHPEALMVPAGKIYLPSVLLGINRSGDEKELAMEFVRCILSFEVQQEDLSDGFPVNKKALDAMAESDKPGYSLGVGVEDYQLYAEWPSLEERKELAEMMKELTVPALVDETIMQMIVDGSVRYYEGNMSVEQAAGEILRKLSIYQAE